MRLPFTIDQFLDVFRRYNLAVWPAQWVLTMLGIVAVVLALSERRSVGRLVSAILALFWLWMAAAYHLAFFAIINRAAVAFAAAFAAQGALFAWLALRTRAVTYRPRSRSTRIVGTLLLVYAIVGYPVLGNAFGHRYPAAPTFGVPCPTTIYTLGLIAWASDSLPWRLLVVPLAWSIVGTSAAFNLAMAEDFGLLAAAIATAVTRVRRDGRWRWIHPSGWRAEA